MKPNEIKEFLRDAELQADDFGDRKASDMLGSALGYIEELEGDLADFKASQHYRYIGIDGKPVLARDLEDRLIEASKRIAELENGK